MYRPVRSGHKSVFAIISVAVLLFATAYGDYANGADFKSEDELVDETRANVEEHLNSKWQASSPVIKEKAVTETPKIVKEAPIIEKESLPAEEEQPPLAKEEQIPVVENKPVTVETTQIAEEAPASAKEDPPTVQDPPPAVKKEEAKEEIPPDVTSVSKEPPSSLDFRQQGIMSDLVAEPVLKKMDVNRIGSEVSYETFQGLRPFDFKLPKQLATLKYLTVAQRVEIYQEARPVDSYIMDAFAIRQIYPNTPWNIKSDYRTQLTPIFTRAYGTEITWSNPKNPTEALIRYTHDYRDIYKNYFPKYQYSALNPNTGETIDNFIKKEMWDQNEILFMHSKQIEPMGWNYTSNLGYRYSTMSAKDGDPYNSYYQIRNTYFGSLSLAPNPKLEWFGQAEYFKSKYVKCSWDYNPDHYLGRMELRIKSNDMKTTYVPSFSYSKDYYYPFADTYQKYEIYYRVGRDFTKRFSATSTVKYVMSLRDTPDNKAPTYVISNPVKDKAYALALENRFSYNVYDRLYLQAGLDIANGLNWSIFDNFAMMAGLEYYAPGMIRVDFGWNGNYYYNLQDFMSSVYFKFYLFM